VATDVLLATPYDRKQILVLRSVPLKKRSRLFTVSALVFGGFLSASASPILLGSYGTSALNPGVANSATTYDPLDSTVNNGSNSTFDIDPGTTWHAPTGNSSYVSFNAATGPTSSLVVPNGTYVYNTTFTITPADVADIGTMTVLADDTVSVFLNNVLIQQSAGPMGPNNSYAKCSDTGPNCIAPFTFTFTGLTDGLNELTFDVKQVNGASEGLDFSGSISDASAVPEPFSLALFGTGLLGLVGLSRRYVADK
jgi:PEP-CTERM motif